MKRLILLLLPISAFAGLSVVEKHDGWQLTVGTKVSSYSTYADCLAAASKAVGVSKCKDVTTITVTGVCTDVPKPPLPANTEAVAVQISDTVWKTVVTAWIPGKYPNCWTLGKGDLVYTNEAAQGEPDLSPGPWVYGQDYPVGTACPTEALAGCYVPPHPDIPPP